MFNDTELLEEDYISQSVDYMTKSHLRNVMQLAVFTTQNDNRYAINISKVYSFVIKENVEILRPPSGNEYVIGMINIRGDVISVVDFNKWIGEENSKVEQKVIIVCNYNQSKIGILVENILKIEEKSSEELRVPQSKDEKISYVTEIEDGGKNRLCIIFDAEKLLHEANKHDHSSKTTIYDISSLDPLDLMSQKNSSKVTLVAEDSKIVIKKLHEFFSKLGINYEIYENGQELIDRVESLDKDDIAMVITDIEMPIKNGYQVISFIKNNHLYKEIPILSLTSMTNQGVLDKVKELGAIDLVNKSDLNTLHRYLKQIVGV